MKRKMTKANVVFCSSDMAARAESAGDEREDEEEVEEEVEKEDRATKCPPEEYSRDERAEVKGSPSIIQQDKCVAGAGQHCRSHEGHRGIVLNPALPSPVRWTSLSEETHDQSKTINMEEFLTAEKHSQ